MDDKTQQMLDTISTMEEEIARLKSEMQTQPPDNQMQSQQPTPQPQPVQNVEQPKEVQSESQAEIQQPTELASSDNTEEVESIPLVGRQGYFDGVFMIGDIEDKKFQVPPNYVSKSLLVIGDRMEIVDVDETGSKYFFKQLDHVGRKEVQGILTKKDNQWAVLTPDGKTYFVVAAAVKYYGGEIGDKAVIILPDQEVPVEIVEWAALKELHKANGEIKGPASEAAVSEIVQPQAQKQVYTQTQATTPTPTPPPQTIQPSQPITPQMNTAVSDQSPVSKPAQTVVSQEATQHQQSVQQPVLATGFDQQIPVQQPQQIEQQPTNTETPVASHSQGEVTVDLGPNGDQATVGEVDLTEEQLWELR